MNNRDFGETYAVVELKNNAGAVALSTDDPTNMKVKVFFEKDAPNQHNLNVPNWFYYWSQIAQAHLTVPGIKIYNTHTQSFNNFANDFSFTLKYHDKNRFAWPPLQIGLPQGGYTESATYGRNEPASYSIHSGAWPIYNNRFGTGYPSINGVAITDIIIGKGCGYHFIDPQKNATGIEVFCETVFHELEHWKIFVENWKDGIDLSKDNDLDGYNDEWESMTQGFDPDRDDSYNLTYQNEPHKKSYGYIWEEDKCRSEQVKHTTKFNNNDWSYSKSSRYQGKNYKKNN